MPGPALRSLDLARNGALFVAAVSLCACAIPTGLDFDREQYTPIPRLEDLDGSAIEPAQDWRYWELREGGGGDDFALVSGGTAANDDLEPAVAAALDSTRAVDGFGRGCPPAYCFRYLVAVADSSPVLADTREELRSFLGTVESVEEAILLVAALDYVRWDDGEDTGYRAVDGGWDLVVFELTNHCSPVQTDHVRFHVDAHGSVIERERAVWERERFACI